MGLLACPGGFLLHGAIPMMEYPKKGQYYAHKTFRLMHKAMVAAELGRDVFCLLAVILHTEDAARYRGPVSYFNSQLMETLGFRKWETFDAARKRAIEAGWLQYEGCGKRTAGRYFVTIPEGYEQIEDGLMEECTYPENGYKQGYDAGIIEGIKRGQSGVQSGDDWGEPPILSPNPIPNPIPKYSSELSQASEPVDTTLVFDLVGKDSGPWSPPLSLIAQFESWYPSLHVDAELRKAAAWHATNPVKRKTRTGITKFLNGWLSKANDGGGLKKPTANDDVPF